MESPYYEMTHDFEEENRLFQSGYIKGYHDAVMKCPDIVRCKDCKHGSIYMTEDVCGKTLIECNHPELGDNIEIHAWDWFCADGERK